MKLNKIYEGILSTAGLIIEDGVVYGMLDDAKIPVSVKGKSVVLPTPVHQKDPQNKVFFHPFNENLVEGVSNTLEKFRSLFVARLNTVLGLVTYQLIELAASPAEHKRLSPKQVEVLVNLKDADEKTLENFKKILKEMPINESNKGFVSVFLRRGPTINGKKYARGAIASFPLFEELSSDKREAYGVKLRVKDVDCLMSILKTIFPNIDVKHEYSVGSDSDIAPFADSMFRFALKAIENITKLIDLFDDEFNSDGAMSFNTDWAKHAMDLKELLPQIRLIPMLATSDEERVPASKTPEPGNMIGLDAAKPSSTPPWEDEKKSPEVTEVKKEEIPARGPVPLRLMMPEEVKPDPLAQHLHNLQPIQQVIPQVHQQNALLQSMLPAQTTGIVKNQNGVDFDSILRSDPALASRVQTSMYPPGAVAGTLQQQWNADRYFAPAAPTGGIMGMNGGYQGV